MKHIHTESNACYIEESMQTKYATCNRSACHAANLRAMKHIHTESNACTRFCK